jgi:Zn-finger nucleic acid-binding protein
VHVEQCAHCHGCFARTEDFSELVRLEEAGQTVDLCPFVPLAPGRELPRQVLLDPVQCPHCRREMDRVRFAHRASIVVDVCLAAHGIWLDAGELVAIVNFVKQRNEGKVTPDAAEIEDEQRWERLRAVHAEEARVVEAHVARMEERQVGAGTIALATAVGGPWAGLFVALRGVGRRR